MNLRRIIASTIPSTLLISFLSCGSPHNNSPQNNSSQSINPNQLLSPRARSDLEEGIKKVARGEANKGYAGLVDNVGYKASGKVKHLGYTDHVPVIISTNDGKTWEIFDYSVVRGEIQHSEYKGRNTSGQNFLLNF